MSLLAGACLSRSGSWNLRRANLIASKLRTSIFTSRLAAPDRPRSTWCQWLTPEPGRQTDRNAEITKRSRRRSRCRGIYSPEVSLGHAENGFGAGAEHRSNISAPIATNGKRSSITRSRRRMNDAAARGKSNCSGPGQRASRATLSAPRSCAEMTQRPFPSGHRSPEPLRRPAENSRTNKLAENGIKLEQLSFRSCSPLQRSASAPTKATSLAGFYTNRRRKWSGADSIR